MKEGLHDAQFVSTPPLPIYLQPPPPKATVSVPSTYLIFVSCAWLKWPASTTASESSTFCASTVTWPFEPVSFSHLRYSRSCSSVRVACEQRVCGKLCENRVYVKQIVVFFSVRYTIDILKHGKWTLQAKCWCMKCSVTSGVKQTSFVSVFCATSLRSCRSV
jgi:hypothetical protein